MTATATTASSGTPSTRLAVNAARPGGGLTLRPRPRVIATESTTRPLDSVAMIGGMRSRRMSPTLNTPTVTPPPTAASRPGTIIAS